MNKLSETRLWRTQIQVLDIAENHCECFVAGRSYDRPVRIKLSDIPDNIKKVMARGKILHARVNVGAKSDSDLSFHDWEQS